MKPSSLLFPHLFLLLSMLTMSHTIVSQNLINSTCKILSLTNRNIDYGFCMASLQAAPGRPDADLEGLGKTAMGLIHDNVTDTEDYIKQLLKNKTLDAYLKQCLTDCLEVYSDAILSTEDATVYYETHRYLDANVQLSAVMADSGSCEEGFKDGGYVPSPLTERNANTYQLSSIALGIMHLLVKPVQYE